MISKATIDKIFSTIRVEEIIGEYVQLKRAGTNFKGLSPFQDEKSPSFVVSPSKQIWKDFSTGKGGTAISFLMEIENFTYPEALKHAAKKYGIEVEETIRQLSEEEKIQESDRDLLYKIHEIANEYFQDQLHQSEEGISIGLSYFKERELKPIVIEKFQLGYSLENKFAFTDFALEKGYQKEILEKSGLSIFPENSEKGIDRFRGRVLFPIHSFSGRVLGFGGRILNNNLKTAKYLNSPETDIYHKSQVLYGLYQSKQAISKNNLCLLVEGYMDVISLHQNGIENVVSSSGTALSIDQIKLIKRLTENVTILFDGDAPGIKASFRSIDLLLSQGMNIRVVLFPDGEDPDSFSRKNSQEFVKNYLDAEAKDFIDFKAEVLLKEADTDPIKKAEAIRDIVKSVAFVQNALKQEVYLKEVATKFGISEQTLFNELGIQKQIKQKDEPAVQVKAPVKLQVVTENLVLINPLLELEDRLIQLILKNGDVVLTRKDDEDNPFEITVLEEIIMHIYEDDYEVQNPLNQKIFSEIKEGLEKDELRAGQFFLSLMDEGISTKIADALIDSHENSDWGRHNIYFPSLDEKIGEAVAETLLKHKREYIQSIILKLKNELQQENLSEERRSEIYKTIMKITQLRNQIAQEVYRVL